MSEVLIISADSKIALPAMTREFDLIFVDGDHSAEGCSTDMDNSLRLLSPEGIMMVDDLDNEHHPYLRQVVTDFAASHKLRMTSHAVHAGVAELRRQPIPDAHLLHS